MKPTEKVNTNCKLPITLSLDVAEGVSEPYPAQSIVKQHEFI